MVCQHLLEVKRCKIQTPLIQSRLRPLIRTVLSATQVPNYRKASREGTSFVKKHVYNIRIIQTSAKKREEAHMFQMNMSLTGNVIYYIFHFLLLFTPYEILLRNTVLVYQEGKNKS